MEHVKDADQPHGGYEICREHGMYFDAGEFTDFKKSYTLGKDDQVHPLEAAVPENQPLQLLGAREGNVYCLFPLLNLPQNPRISY